MRGPNWRLLARMELRRLASAFRRGCTWGTLGYAMCLWALVAGNLMFDGSFARTPFETLVALAAAAIYLTITGLVFGLATGLVEVGRALVGRWVLVPVIAVPVGAALALGLATEFLSGRADALAQAVEVAAVERDWLSYDLDKVGHAGPLMFTLMLPLLFMDLGAILLDTQVLMGIMGVIVTLAGLVLVGAAPAVGLSLLVVLAGAVRRGGWARMGWIVAAMGSPPPPQRSP